MTPDQIAMLVGGIVLFVVALGVLIYCIVTRRSFTAVIVLFVVAIIMIAYPKITSFKLPGGIEVVLDKNIKAVQENPNDPAAKANLAATVAQASKEPNLAPNTRLTLAKAQSLLGQQEEAEANVKAAVKAQPNLKQRAIVLFPHR
jgi:hypothetical protein